MSKVYKVKRLYSASDGLLTESTLQPLKPVFQGPAKGLLGAVEKAAPTIIKRI